MSTSLQEQLRRLAVPQTTSLVDFTIKDSILFDPKEAATKDRRTIYDLGVSGLQDLIALNYNFQQFETTLFEETTIDLERSVEQKDVNKLLDENINKFLRLLSPYFLLRPAHLCLEWLIRRFQIHEYNRKQLLALAFPYHETNIFIKVLQTLRIRKGDQEWDWLRPMKKPGLPIPKTGIINRASTDNNFYSFICNNIVEIIKEWRSQAHMCQAHINFYATVIVGALDNSRTIQEWHITSMLASLLKSFQSQVTDLIGAAYVISALLLSRTQITFKLCQALINNIVKNPPERLRESSVMLLIYIFDSQKAAKPRLSEDNLLNLYQKEWFLNCLAELENKNHDLKPLYHALVSQSVALIQNNNEHISDLKDFMGRLLSDIRLSDSDAMEFIKCFLNAYEPHANEDRSVTNDVIELNTDDEMDGSNEFNNWYSNFLKSIEQKYPKAFDEAIKEELQSTDRRNHNRYAAVKMALGYRLKMSSKDSTDIYESLYHYSADVRLNAMEALLQNLNDYKSRSQNFQILKECLADRIKDESEKVVFEVLKLSVNDLIEILGHHELVEALRSLIFKIQSDYQRWSHVAEAAVKLLTSPEIIKNYDSNLIILILMPILYPEDELNLNVPSVKIILKSSLSEKIPFLKALSKEKGWISMEPQDYKAVFLQNICSNPINIKDLFKSVKNAEQNFIKTSNQLTHLTIVATVASSEPLSPSESLEIFNFMKICKERFDSKFSGPTSSSEKRKSKHSQAVLFGNFVLRLIKNTKLEALNSWAENNESLLCFFTILEFLVNKAFQQNNKLEWMEVIKGIMNSILTTAQDKINFLTNFYCLPKASLPVNYDILRLFGFKLLISMLQNKKESYKLDKDAIYKIIIGLSSESETMRLLAIETLKYAIQSNKIEEYLKQFIESILEAENEVAMDPEQFALILFTLLNSSKSNKKKLTWSSRVMREIMKFLCSAETTKDIVFKAQLLKIIKHINSEEIVKDLLPLGSLVLDQTRTNEKIEMLDEPYDDIFQMIFERFTHRIVGNLFTDSPNSWIFFEKVFSKYDVFIAVDDKLMPVPCVALKLLDEATYAEFPAEYRLKFIKLILQTVALSENDEIFLEANKLLKKCSINCEPLSKLFTKMCENSSASSTTKVVKRTMKTQQQKRESIASNIDTSSSSWKEGLVLIELLENKKNLTNAFKLIAPLFELLKACVEIDESQNVEYIKQITLSLLLHCCKSAEAEGFDLQQMKPEAVFRVDYVVQCLRSSHNPQTHNNALLLLSHCANIVPQQVLTEIVAIFTFMGSSVVRQDDAFSFHIINNIISSIIPILVMNETQVSDTLVIPVLKVFSDIILDVPEHRRQILYTKLLHTLGPDKFLWMFLCVLFEAHVINDEKERKTQKKNAKQNISPNHLNDDKVNKRMEIALELTNTFEPSIIVQTCINLLTYIQKLPLDKAKDKDENEATTQSLAAKKLASEDPEENLFNITCRTAKELRHYRYIILQYLSNISSSQNFLRKISSLTAEESLAMKPFYQNLIIKTLSCVPLANGALEKSEESSQVKFWKVVINNLHDVLDNAISLLSPEMFLLVITGLMQHQLLSVRRKVIEILISKLQKQNEFFTSCSPEHFHSLLDLLSKNVDLMLDKTETIVTNSDLLQIQQTNLLAIKLIARQFGMQFMNHFKELLVTLTKVLKNRSSIPKMLCATVVLTLVEICSTLKAHSLAQLPKFIPHLISVLLEQSVFLRDHLPDNATTAIVAGMQKLIEALPLFLGRHTADIIVGLSTISIRIRENKFNGKDPKSSAILQRIVTIWDQMSTVIPPRNIVPYCFRSYNNLLEGKQYAEITLVFDLLKQRITKSTNNELIGVQSDLCDFFLQALEFRSYSKQNDLNDQEMVSNVEQTIIDAFVAWVLKMSESHFRPIYHKLFEWAITQTGTKQSALTYFRLTYNISEALKTLFVLFASDFVEDAARLLNECNSNKSSLEDEDQDTKAHLIKSILSTLTNIFLYDSKQFVNSQRFDVLMRSIVDQLDNTLVLENDELVELLTKCIAQFAVAVSSDVLWKQLNYEILLKTRSNIPEVRILSFNCCVEIARKLGEDFSPLLPETVPFIAELFEDENQRVEKNTRKSVQELETILGESLQKYL